MTNPTAVVIYTDWYLRSIFMYTFNYIELINSDQIFNSIYLYELIHYTQFVLTNKI